VKLSVANKELDIIELKGGHWCVSMFRGLEETEQCQGNSVGNSQVVGYVASRVFVWVDGPHTREYLPNTL
jgi:hypothetical protein